MRLALEERIQAAGHSGERVGSTTSAHPADGWGKDRSRSPPSWEGKKRVTAEEGGRRGKR